MGGTNLDKHPTTKPTNGLHFNLFFVYAKIKKYNYMIFFCLKMQNFILNILVYLNILDYSLFIFGYIHFLEIEIL